MLNFFKIFLIFFFSFFSLLQASLKKDLIQEPKGIVMIDPGHGGKDYGALSEGHGYEEKQLTLTTALIVKNYLQKLGYRVQMTRSQDVFIPLQTRANLANEQKALLFVSIHFNFCANTSASGIEIYYCKENQSSDRILLSKKLAEEIDKRIQKHTGAHSRGIKTANFLVLKQTEMPAILIEGGFLSNAEERKKIKDPRYLSFIAWGIARGIHHYLGSN